MIPEVLRKWIPGAPEFIPYSKELPEDTTSAKAKAKSSDKGVKQKVAAAGAAVADAGKKLGDMTVKE